MLMKLMREESDKAFPKLWRRGCKLLLLALEVWISFLLSAHRGCGSLGSWCLSSPSQAQDMNL